MIKCFAVSPAQVASFNDPRCDGGAVCPNDPLLFTCTVTDAPATSNRVTLPFSVSVGVTNTNMTEVVSSGGGAATLPDGVDIHILSPNLHQVADFPLLSTIKTKRSSASLKS